MTAFTLPYFQVLALYARVSINIEPRATPTKPHGGCLRIPNILLQAPEWMVTKCVAFCSLTW